MVHMIHVGWTLSERSYMTTYSQITTVIQLLSTELEGKELGPWRFRLLYANQSLELDFLLLLGKKRSEFRRKRDLYEPLLTAMAQVLPFLIEILRGFLVLRRWIVFFCRFCATDFPPCFCGKLRAAPLQKEIGPKFLFARQKCREIPRQNPLQESLTHLCKQTGPNCALIINQFSMFQGTAWRQFPESFNISLFLHLEREELGP